MDEHHQRLVDELMRRVGRLLLKWGQLETGLAFAVYQLMHDDDRAMVTEDTVPRTLSRMLTDWRRAHSKSPLGKDRHHMKAVDALRVAINDASTMRNNVCHGMRSLSVLPRVPTAAISCEVKYLHNRLIHNRMPQASYTLEQLEAEIELIDSFISMVVRLQNPPVTVLVMEGKKVLG
jgi:hypothetical protein